MSKIDYLIQTIGIVQKFIWISTDPYSSANFGTKFNSTPSHHILLASSLGLLKPIPACQKYFKIFYFANYAMALKAQRQVVGPAWLPAHLPTHLCMIPSKWIRSVKFCKFWPFFRRDFDACKTPRRPPPHSSPDILLLAAIISSHEQCDQIAGLLFNIWPCTSIKKLPKRIQNLLK